MNPDRWQPEPHNPQDPSCCCALCCRDADQSRRLARLEQAREDGENPMWRGEYPEPKTP